jgi:hypothetical protein
VWDKGLLLRGQAVLDARLPAVWDAVIDNSVVDFLADGHPQAGLRGSVFGNVFQSRFVLWFIEFDDLIGPIEGPRISPAPAQRRLPNYDIVNRWQNKRQVACGSKK